ncbi:hypothetical protein ACGFX4_31785 [Kitasatospora sp. NPDC048365]|uniref:hypothetical protein n=1 Tax=Kitasatospora sp. NPDC048365 TaxID=3364050 RepID=UPI00371DDDBC
METVWVDRSDPDAIDLVLTGDDPSPRFAAGVSLDVGRSLPLLFLLGTLLAVPVCVVMRLAGAGWGPVWAAAGIAGAIGAVVPATVVVYTAFFLRVHRLRFSPAAAPTTVALVRAARAARPRPLTEVRQIRIDRSVEEPYEGDPLPETVTVTLTVRLAHGWVAPKPLPADTDAAALYRELHELLSPAVPVALFVRRHPRPVPPPPSKIDFGALGRGGSSTGGC